MKSLFLSCITVLALFLLESFEVHANDKGPFKLTGRLLDNNNHQPVEYASVAAYQLPDTLLVTGAITESGGHFGFSLQTGKYILRISFVGYQTLWLPVEMSGSLTLDPVLLSPSVALQGVQVIASQNEKQANIERTSLQVSQSMGAVSGNLNEVLRSHPAISSDADGNISLRGNSSLLILVDGIPTTLEVLQTMPASAVESLEIITQPDARYDAEGTAGIINIISRKASHGGLSGAFSTNTGNSRRMNGSLQLHNKSEKYDVGFTYGGRYEQNEVSSSFYRLLHQSGTRVEQQIRSKQTSPLHSASLQLSARPSKHQQIALMLAAKMPRIHNLQSIDGYQYVVGKAADHYLRQNDITFSRRTLEGSLSWSLLGEKGKPVLSLEAAFSATRGRRPAQYFLSDQLVQRSTGGGAPTNMSLQADYQIPLRAGGTLETGVKGFARWNHFNYHFYEMDLTGNWLLNPAYSNDLQHRENILASYLMYSSKLFDKLQLKAGGRLEYNSSILLQQSLNDTIISAKLYPFPFLQLQYGLQNGQQLSFNLNRRVTRPVYPQLNPFINVIDQTTYETGNKNLQPALAHNISLFYSSVRTNGSFRTSLYFNTTRDFLTQVSQLTPEDKLIITWINGQHQDVLGTDIDWLYHLTKHLTLNPSLSVFQTWSVAGQPGLDAQDLAFTANLKLTAIPQPATQLQLFVAFQSARQLPQFHLEEIWYADVSLRHHFRGNHFTATLTLSDIFNTRNWNIHSANPVYQLHNFSKGQTRILWLGISYRFNSFSQRNNQQPGAGEEAEGMIRLGQ